VNLLIVTFVQFPGFQEIVHSSPALKTSPGPGSVGVKVSPATIETKVKRKRRFDMIEMSIPDQCSRNKKGRTKLTRLNVIRGYEAAYVNRLATRFLRPFSE
jgi:hypothetical protein